MWKSSFLNLIGMVIPSVIAIPAMAIMSRMLGIEKFGLFMLAFSLLGYASIFDAGLTRSVIRLIANNDDNQENKTIIGTATFSVLFLSIIAVCIFSIFSESIVSLLNIEVISHDDAKRAFNLLAFVIPVYLLSSIWFAYLEGKQRFFTLNVYKVITGSIISLFPVLFTYYGKTLFYSVLGLLVARILTMFLAFHSCFNGMRGSFFIFRIDMLKKLISFGGWITISNIISPLMVYADRFLLAHLNGANQVAFYTAPAEAIARMGIVPGSLARTIFPLFSREKNDNQNITNQAYRGLSIINLLMMVPVFIFSEFILNIWLGETFGRNSSIIFRVLLVGFFFNSLAQIPFSRIQAHGDSRLTTIIHLIEILPYIILLSVLVNTYGLLGAAIAWSLRVIFDFLILEYYSRRIGLI